MAESTSKPNPKPQVPPPGVVDIEIGGVTTIEVQLEPLAQRPGQACLNVARGAVFMGFKVDDIGDSGAIGEFVLSTHIELGFDLGTRRAEECIFGAQTGAAGHVGVILEGDIVITIKEAIPSYVGDLELKLGLDNQSGNNRQ